MMNLTLTQRRLLIERAKRYGETIVVLPLDGSMDMVAVNVRTKQITPYKYHEDCGPA